MRPPPPTATNGRATACTTVAVLVATALGVGGADPSAAQPDALPADLRAWAEANAPLIHGYERSYPPFEFVDRSGHASGINLDLMDRIARNLDVRIEKRPYDDFDALLAATRSGEVDVVGTVNRTSEREPVLDFSHAYVRLSSAFYVTDRHPDVRSIEDLKGLRVGILPAYVSGQWLTHNHPELATVEATDLEELLSLLVTGQVDAVFEETATVGYMARDRALTNIRILDAGLFLESDQHWATRQGNVEMVRILDIGMKTIPPGERTAVFQFWTGYDLGIEKQKGAAIGAWLRTLLLVGGGLLVVVAAWSVALRVEVRSRTDQLRDELRRREAAEQQVLKANRELEERVAQRTRQLAASNDDLRQFASTLSHDLQSPLSVVNLRLDLLRGNDSPEKVQEHADKIQEMSDRMGGLIRSTLAYSAAGAAQPMEDVPLGEVAKAACSLLEQPIRQSAAEVDIAPLPVVHASRVQMTQLFQNLVGNAIKFRRPEVRPRVRVWAQEEGVWHKVHVEDNGLGFDASAAPRLMEPFHRLDAHRHVPGHGLGLAACARIVERHGGRMEVESTPGIGSRFTVVLPAARRE